MNEASIRSENEMTLLKRINAALRATIQQQAQHIERLTAERDEARRDYEQVKEAFDALSRGATEAQMAAIYESQTVRNAAQEVLSLKRQMVDRDATIAELTKARDDWQTRCEDKWDANTLLRREMDKLRENFNCECRVTESLQKQLAQAEQREQRLREAVQGLLDIGKLNLTNPKYDGYFESLREALGAEQYPSPHREGAPHRER